MEIWKDVVGFEGLYKVSNTGKLKSLDRKDSLGHNIRGKQISTKKNNRGYVQVHLTKDGKCHMKLMHRLVAEAFIENKNNLPQVNHKDEDKDNNTVENLEWCTNLYNRRYGTGYARSCDKHDYKAIALTNSKKVKQFSKDGSLIAEYISISAARRATGVSDSCIRKCCNKTTMQAKGYVWAWG